MAELMPSENTILFFMPDRTSAHGLSPILNPNLAISSCMTLGTTVNSSILFGGDAGQLTPLAFAHGRSPK